MPPVLGFLLRQHLLFAQRTTVIDAEKIGHETQQLVVGFVDLVGSTEPAEELSIRELGTTPSVFEELAMDTVIGACGRMVKLIGDEVLYHAPDAKSACSIALALAKATREHELLPDIRAAVAGGNVMLRDGDVFGRVVNLAARIVKVAEPGEVLATKDVAFASGLSYTERDPVELRGISAEVELPTLLL